MENNTGKSFETIKQSLHGYKEEYIPGSWESFLLQRMNNRRKLYWRIASGIAASFLIFLAGSTYYYFENEKVTTTIVTSIPDPDPTSPRTEPGNVPKPATALVAELPGSTLRKSAETTDQSSHGQKKTLTPTVQNQAPALPAVPGPTPVTPAESSALVANNVAGKIQTAPDTTRNTGDTPKDTANNVFWGIPPAAGNPALAASSKRKVRFGINFSPGISTSQSSGSFNYTGGLSADIPLSSSFQLTTGLQVENQSIVKNIPGIVSSSNTPQNQEMTKVTNLDVPLNLTWKFFSEKSRAYYVSAGLSSLVYLWEQDKNTTYSQDLVPVASLVAGQEILSYKVVDQVSVAQYAGTPDQTFDLAGRVNILVGFETKLSGKLLIHIEPYAKIPTSGQAPANLNHTSTGINFKISF